MKNTHAKPHRILWADDDPDDLEIFREVLSAISHDDYEITEVRNGEEVLEELERSADDLVRQYAAVVPESLDAISPEEKHQIYKTLRMKVLVNIEGTVAVETISSKVTELEPSSVKIGDLCL